MSDGVNAQIAEGCSADELRGACCAASKTAKKGVFLRAERYLRGRGFVRGEHWKTRADLLTLASRVQAEQDRKRVYGIEETIRWEPAQMLCPQECGWDGRSPTCECGRVHFRAGVRGLYPSATFTPIVDSCAQGCGRFWFDVCKKCGWRLCQICLARHKEEGDCP